MADGEYEVGAVHGVEMKGIDAVLCQFLYLACGDGGRDQFAGFGIVVEAFEFLREPVRHTGAGAGDKIAGLLEIVHRHDAGHDRNCDAAGANPVEIAEVEVVVEEDLRNGAGGAGIDFCFQEIDVSIEVRAFRMFFGIGGNRNLDIAMPPLDAGDEFGRTAIAVGMRRVRRADAAGRVAAQRDDMADADVVIAADDLVDLATRGAHAGQMRGRQQVGLSQDAGDGGMGALPRRSAGAIGHRDEIGRQRRETFYRLKQAAFHLLRLGREELERDVRGFGRAVRGGRNLGHGNHKLHSIRSGIEV